MTLSPVYIGRPQETREPVEQRVYDLLDALQISYQRVDHDPAYDMDACAGISQALGIHICKNLLLTPRNRSAFYLLAMPEDLPFRTADFPKSSAPPVLALPPVRTCRPFWVCIRVLPRCWGL